MEHKIPHRSTEKNKKLLLEVAAKLFLQKGYTATTLREIAKEAVVHARPNMRRNRNLRRNSNGKYGTRNFSLLLLRETAILKKRANVVP